MAETSYFWGGAGGDARDWSSSDLSILFRRLFQTDRATQGVLKGQMNELAITYSAPNVLVDSGCGMVDGKLYTNSVSVSLAISAGGADRYYSVVIRKSWAAQTVRLTLIGPGASIPAITQSDGVTWDVLIATVKITPGGVVTITDEREFCHYSGEMLSSHINWDLLTSKGSMIAGSGVGTVGVLSPGTDFQVIQSRAAAPLGIEWASMIGVVLHNTTPQSLPTGGFAYVVTGLSVMGTDPYGFFAPAYPTRITIPVGMDGWYLVGLDTVWSVSGAYAKTSVEVYLDGTLMFADSQIPGSVAKNSICCLLPLAAGEVLTALLRGTSTAGATALSKFWALRAR